MRWFNWWEAVWVALTFRRSNSLRRVCRHQQWYMLGCSNVSPTWYYCYSELDNSLLSALMDWMFVCSQIQMSKSSPSISWYLEMGYLRGNWSGMRSWDEFLMMGLLPLQEETQKKLFSLCTMCGYSKNVAVCKLGRKLSPETKPCWTLILDFSVFRIVRK